MSNQNQNQLLLWNFSPAPPAPPEAPPEAPIEVADCDIDSITDEEFQTAREEGFSGTRADLQALFDAEGVGAPSTRRHCARLNIPVPPYTREKLYQAAHSLAGKGGKRLIALIKVLYDTRIK